MPALFSVSVSDYRPNSYSHATIEIVEEVPFWDLFENMQLPHIAGMHTNSIWTI